MLPAFSLPALCSVLTQLLSRDNDPNTLLAVTTCRQNNTAPPALLEPAMDPRFYVMSVDLALWVADPPLPLAPPRLAPDEVRPCRRATSAISEHRRRGVNDVLETT